MTKFEIPEIISREKLEKYSLIKMREETIINLTKNNTLLESLKEARTKDNNHGDLELVKKIRDLEVYVVAAEEDLSLVEGKLEKLKEDSEKTKV